MLYCNTTIVTVQNYKVRLKGEIISLSLSLK